MNQLVRTDLHVAIEHRYPDNMTGDITPQLLRDGLHELVDSVFVTASDTGAVPNVPVYDPAATYVVGYTVRYTPLGGQEAFYAALKAGKLPAPVAANDVNWKVVPGPVTTTALGQALTQTQAISVNGTATVVLGRDYAITFPKNTAGYDQVVTVAGTAGNWLASEGWLLVNQVRTKIKNLDLVAGTWEVDTRYTQAQVDQLLTNKQGAVSEQITVSLYGATGGLTRATFGKYLHAITSQDILVDLPRPALTEVGQILAVHNYSGPGAVATVTWQAMLGTDTVATRITSTPRGYVTLFEIVTLHRSYPTLDTVAAYAVLSNTLVEPQAPAAASGVTAADLDAVRTTLALTATRSADYTLVLSDAGCLVPVASSSAVTVTVPAHADVAFPVGTTLYVAQDGAGGVTIAAASGVLVNTADGYKVAGQWLDVALHKRDLNTWVLKGGIK